MAEKCFVVVHSSTSCLFFKAGIFFYFFICLPSKERVFSPIIRSESRKRRREGDLSLFFTFYALSQGFTAADAATAFLTSETAAATSSAGPPPGSLSSLPTLVSTCLGVGRANLPSLSVASAAADAASVEGFVVAANAFPTGLDSTAAETWLNALANGASASSLVSQSDFSEVLFVLLTSPPARSPPALSCPNGVAIASWKKAAFAALVLLYAAKTAEAVELSALSAAATCSGVKVRTLASWSAASVAGGWLGSARAGEERRRSRAQKKKEAVAVFAANDVIAEIRICFMLGKNSSTRRGFVQTIFVFLQSIREPFA